MFSGIVRGIEKSIYLEKDQTSVRLTIAIPKGWDINEGESISIDGICSTVTNVKKKNFQVFYMHETLKKTTIGNLSENHLFNLELSMRLNDLVGGHLVTGHIDTAAKVSKIQKDGESRVITFVIPRAFSKYIVQKGSITINGVSLTVVDVTKSFFTVSLIPYTLQNTNLGHLSVGNHVNIEVDLIAKYLEKLVSGKKKRSM